MPMIFLWLTCSTGKAAAARRAADTHPTTAACRAAAAHPALHLIRNGQLLGGSDKIVVELQRVRHILKSQCPSTFTM